LTPKKNGLSRLNPLFLKNLGGAGSNRLFKQNWVEAVSQQFVKKMVGLLQSILLLKKNGWTRLNPLLCEKVGLVQL